MAVSFAYRDAVRHRKRKWRRFEVVFFFMLMAIGLSEAGRPSTWTNFGLAALPYLLAASRLMSWSRIGVVPITSLDDLAMEDYGVEFEQTTPAQQTYLLRRSRHDRRRTQERPYYRAGTYTLSRYPDEYEEARERETHLRACEFCDLSCHRLRCSIGLGGSCCRKAACVLRGPTARWWLPGLSSARAASDAAHVERA